MSNFNYDIIIVGGGPGGYIAAERAGAKGKKVLLVEKGHLGGVCLNEGCIPSKTLLYSSKMFHAAAHGAKYGVLVDNPRFDLGSAMARKLKVMETLRKGVASLMRQFKVEVVAGEASMVDSHTVKVGEKSYAAQNVILATGSSPIRPPLPGADRKHVLTSTEIFDIEALPKAVAIIGGGVIGCEFACFFAQVGVKVTVIEMMPEILPVVDAELVGLFKRALSSDLGVDFRTGAKAESIGENTVTIDTAGKKDTVPADLVLLAIGRTPNTQGLGFEKIGLDMDRRGIKVDEQMRTNIPNVYAIGDVNGRSMLAHSASRMAEVAVNTLCGGRDRMRYEAVPWVVYTAPEIASVGLTEAEAQKQGRAVKVSKLPLSVSGRFLAENEGFRGLCKVVVDAKSEALLGLHLIGSYSSEIIYGAAAMIEGEYRVRDIQEIIFPHPTVGEVFRDALHALPH